MRQERGKEVKANRKSFSEKKIRSLISKTDSKSKIKSYTAKKLNASSRIKQKLKEIYSSPNKIFIPDINQEELDNEIMKLWYRFVVNYDYQDIFPLPSVISKENIQEMDLDDSISKLFEKFSIEINKDQLLTTHSSEGSYILKHPKLWIMYIESLVNKKSKNSEFSYQKLVDILNYCLVNYDCDEHILFDYFIEVTLNFNTEDIFKEENILMPSKFISLYNQNKNRIDKIFLSKKDNKTETNDFTDQEEIITQKKIIKKELKRK